MCGAVVMCFKQDGWPALCMAASLNNIKIAKTLLTCRVANVNIQGNVSEPVHCMHCTVQGTDDRLQGGYSSLMVASGLGHFAMVQVRLASVCFDCRSLILCLVSF
jgi:hypothetical protein